MNTPCFTSTSSYSSGANRLSLSCEYAAGSPLRQPRLFEALQRLLLGIVDVEHQRKFGHDEDILDLLIHRAELHLGAPLGVVAVGRDQHAQGDAVHERRLA